MQTVCTEWETALIKFPHLTWTLITLRKYFNLISLIIISEMN
jgi:hypothetical protein